MYEFKCLKCNKTVERDIPVERYEAEKYLQKCDCGALMKRVLAWNGIAVGSGAGWCGNSKGNAI